MQDVLARHMRLKTGAAILLPGLDHAGIATQVSRPSARPLPSAV
jgi:valyl-tRNA synthetase